MRPCSKCGLRPGIIKVHLASGVEVHWCGDCINKTLQRRVKKGSRR